MPRPDAPGPLQARGDAFDRRVQVATLDPFHGDKNAIDDRLADADSVFDAFHVVQLGNQVVDPVQASIRRWVQQNIHGHRGRKDDPPYRIRNLLRRTEERLTERQQARLAHAIDADERHLEVFVAWQGAQQRRRIYRQPDPRRPPHRPSTPPVASRRAASSLSTFVDQTVVPASSIRQIQ